MNCAEFKEAAHEWALGTLDAEERSRCEAHVGEARAHEGCIEALAAARAVAAQLSLGANPVRPRAEVWTAIRRKIASSAARDKPRRGAGRVAVFALLAVAVIAIALLARGRERIGDQLAEERSRAASERVAAEHALAAVAAEKEHCERDLQAAKDQLDLRLKAVALLDLPSTRVVRLNTQAGGVGHATAVVNMDKKQAFVLAGNLPAEREKDYQLWVMRAGKPIPAGLLRAGLDGAIVASVSAELLAGGADAFAISVEPLGGGVAPRGPVILVGAMPKS